MPLPPGDFSHLLRELRNAGPLDRVRLLGRSLAALRGLSPWDRKVLLRMAGFDGAEALVERLAGENQETARRLIRVLSDLEEDPEALERTVRDLGDPKRRGRAVDELLATLDRAVAAPAEAEEPEPAAPRDRPAAAGDGLEAGREEPRGPAEKPSPPPPPSPRPAAVEVSEPQAPAPAEAPPSTPPVEAPPPAPPLPEPEAPPEPPPPLPGPAAPAEAPEPQPPPAAPEAVAPPDPFLPLEAPSAVDALETLLDLRRRLDDGGRPGAAELRRLLERELPFPWARRRAIQAWLAAGTVNDVDDLDGALDLIETLPAGPDRSWCLTTLAGARSWRTADWRRIVEASSGPSSRRHLELRRRRG